MNARAACACCLIWLVGLSQQAAYGQSCSVSAPGPAFGVYNPMSLSPVNVTTSVTVSCHASSGTSIAYTIQIGPGQSGSFETRSMSGLRYQLYKDAGRTQIWGDGSGGSQTVTDGYSFTSQGPVNRTYTVYGQLLARQRVTPGSYTDLVTLMMIY